MQLGFTAPRNSGRYRCTGMTDGSAAQPDFEIVDRVRIPAGLTPGDYVLGWVRPAAPSTSFSASRPASAAQHSSPPHARIPRYLACVKCACAPRADSCCRPLPAHARVRAAAMGCAARPPTRPPARSHTTRATCVHVRRHGHRVPLISAQRCLLCVIRCALPFRYATPKAPRVFCFSFRQTVRSPTRSGSPARTSRSRCNGMRRRSGSDVTVV